MNELLFDEQISNDGLHPTSRRCKLSGEAEALFCSQEGFEGPFVLVCVLVSGVSRKVRFPVHNQTRSWDSRRRGREQVGKVCSEPVVESHSHFWGTDFQLTPMPLSSCDLSSSYRNPFLIPATKSLLLYTDLQPYPYTPSLLLYPYALLIGIFILSNHPQTTLVNNFFPC